MYEAVLFTSCHSHDKVIPGMGVRVLDWDEEKIPSLPPQAPSTDIAQTPLWCEPPASRTHVPKGGLCGPLSHVITCKTTHVTSRLLTSIDIMSPPVQSS